jgi:hypothetical protein
LFFDYDKMHRRRAAVCPILIMACQNFLAGGGTPMQEFRWPFGGIEWLPGDTVFADEDGIVVVDRADAERAASLQQD